ncbi:ABC transporter ATP-binding protein [Paenirhodobacter populi]|uniref:ABC transporter ATP-binding protein n=1 Tax=Paenirhodobacter populi TaxID=2306993 RepID=A0A443KQU7_9RHOB|nr:ABC transporter ATP-binding protein [Sinirhodobacter populi]RWR10935.1 ABC transporter ATP-binding protein [Sinirhodobacter populi]RWR32890.1 ABC transporter ATP-binding protein [Sinirhodobacter populi]RWR35344.1 ABC transporter ATP-binding protein [Sinirhodobacter populi]
MWKSYLARHWPKMALAALLMVIEGATLGALSWMLKPLFDKVFVEGQQSMLWLVGGAIFALFVIRAVTSVGSRTLLSNISQGSSTAMQVDLVRHILTLDQSFFQANPPGALIERVQGDTSAVQGVWTVFITGAGRDAISLVSLFGVAISIDWRWTLAALVGAPLLILPTVVVQRYIRRKSRQMRDQSGARATQLDEVFHGIAAVKLNRIEDYQMARFSGLVGWLRHSMVKMAAIQSMIPALIDVVTGLGFFVVLVLGGREIIAGDRTVGEFMSFFAAMSLAFQPLRRLGGLAGTWQSAAASLERIYHVLDITPRVHDPARPLPPPDKMTVRLENVFLSYGEKPVLRGMSFTAEAGKTTALVGPSGAGKSTVFNLLTRMVDPDSGTVSIGGVPVQAMRLADLRELFSTVSQDASLFDETIRENVLLGRRDATPEALAQALSVAHVTEFTDAMPEGLDTPAGPRGSALSGGQRQRVAIARAVLRDAPILLLDEATSALDTRSEAQVAQALDHLSAGRTTLVIAHRLSTVRNADKIVVVSEGRVIEEGTHEALFARGGTYAALCRMQLVE